MGLYENLEFFGFNPSVSNTIKDTFEYMEIAESILSKYDNWIEIEGFIYLRPTKFILGTEVYRIHCTQICNWMKEEKNLDEPTDAEIMGVLCNASLVAPPSRDAVGLYQSLFIKWFGSDILRKSNNEYEEIKPSSQNAFDEIRMIATRDIKRKGELDFRKIKKGFYENRKAKQEKPKQTSFL